MYKQHKLTGDKRSRVRLLARQKIGVRVASASRKSAGRTALYGLRTDGKGTTIKNRIVRSASLQAERLYEALVRQQHEKRSDPDAPFIDRSDLIFDPTRPSETDWDNILKQAADKILRTFKTKPGH